MALSLSLTTSLGSVATLNKGGGVVTPVSILGSDLLAWWTADRADLIALSGSQVSHWRDVVAGYEAVQSLSASRPVYSANGFNGAPGLTFDSVDDELTLPSQPFPSGAAASEIHGILQQDALPADTSARRWFAYGGTTNNDSRYVYRSVVGGTNRASLTTGTGAGLANASVPPIDFSSRHYHRAVTTGTQVRQKLDDGAFESDNPAVPATGSVRVRIGASTSGIGFWNGKIRDILVTLPLSTEKAAALEAWALPRRML